jgi:hypothetical protein
VLQVLQAPSCAKRALRLLSHLTSESSAADPLWRLPRRAAPLLLELALDGCFILLEKLSKRTGSSSSSSSNNSDSGSGGSNSNRGGQKWSGSGPTPAEHGLGGSLRVLAARSWYALSNMTAANMVPKI